MLKDLLLHRHGFYSGAYRLQRDVVPNWSSAILLAAASSLVGTSHAEQLLSSLCVLCGFFGFSYASRKLCPEAEPWSPVANFLLQNSFLPIGFYNFYLGMALCPFAIGYYAAHGTKLSARRAVTLALATIGLFFTHIIAAAVAAITIVAMAVFTVPLKRLIAVFASLLPVAILAAAFAHSAPESVKFKAEVARSFSSFPMDVFITADGRSGKQELLWPAILFFMAISAFAVSSEEWRTPRAGILASAVLTMCLYLFAPDNGFGGQEVKKRLALAVFLLGCLFALSLKRVQTMKLPVSLYVGFFLAGTLVSSLAQARGIGRAVEAYMSAAAGIPNGATFVRIYYPLDSAPVRFGFAGAPLAPLFHADAYIAATRHMIDLSDYQAASGLFPIAYAPAIDMLHRYSLWGLENSANKNSEMMSWLLKTLPVPLDYVVVVGDNPPFDLLDSGLQAVAAPPSFVRVYRRGGAR